MAQKLTSFVDPRIGTGDHGHVFIGANVPFGMVQAGPTQYQWEWDWCSGYHESSDSIIGFSQLHLSGTGCADLGDISLMPWIGKVGGDGLTPSRQSLACHFRHEDEDARAGYYAVTLNPEDEGAQIRCEMTATERVALHRYTFVGSQNKATDKPQSLIIDLENATGTWDRATNCRLQQLDDCTLIGYRYSHGWADKQQVYFAIRFSRPISEMEMFNGTRPNAQGKLYGVIGWDKKYNNEPLMVKVALSPTSEANALLNMKAELDGWDFENTQKTADEKWEKELARVKATFPTERESRIFYTCMFHLMVAPQLWCDVNGDFQTVGNKIVREANYNHLTTWSLWDTYRTVHPLSTIIFSDRSRDYAHTMMEIYNQCGELPVWHLMSNETYCMVGEPAVPVLADIILKGQNGDVDAEAAYKAMEASLEGGPDARGKNWIKRIGYIPFDSEQSESVSKNMEYFIAFWSAAQVAGKLGHKEDSIYLHSVSMNYKKLYDTRVGYMRALSQKGEFRSAEGFNPCHQTRDYTEGNPWQYTFLVPHDVNGLVELVGGKAAFEKKLDALFEADSDLGELANPDITGLIGQYAQGNEPSHHVLYMYNYIGKPHKAQRRIRQVMDTLYDDKPAGLCGNEDVGQMSAWYIMSALGFYQVEPSGGIYQLGCPAVKEAKINCGKNIFTVKTSGNPKKGIVKSWKLNGKKLNRTYITHEEIINGGTLECAF